MVNHKTRPAHLPHINRRDRRSCSPTNPDGRAREGHVLLRHTSHRIAASFRLFSGCTPIMCPDADSALHTLHRNRTNRRSHMHQTGRMPKGCPDYEETSPKRPRPGSSCIPDSPGRASPKGLPARRVRSMSCKRASSSKPYGTRPSTLKNRRKREPSLSDSFKEGVA